MNSFINPPSLAPNTFEETIYWGKWNLEHDRRSKPDALLRILKHIIKGIYYRYPLCCIRQYIGLSLANILPASYVAANLRNHSQFLIYKESKHVPCKYCIEGGIYDKSY